MKKIHIIGPMGSGKSYLSGKLEAALGWPELSLDDIFWDSRRKSYDMKAQKKERNRSLDAFLENERYIVEGVYHSWTDKSFEKADIILVLDRNVFLRDIRILERFIKKKLKFFSQGKKETFKNLLRLLCWNHDYDRKNKLFVKKKLEKYRQKTKYFNRPDDAFSYIMKRMTK